jgi:hypothetical protein
MAADCGVQLAGERVIDNTNVRDVINGKAERDAEIGVCVYEVCGAVDGVDDECWTGGEVRFAGYVRFFANKAV